MEESQVQLSPEEIMANVEENPNPLGDFPSGVQMAVEGLTWLGYLEDEIEVAGHRFVMRTLRGDEELLAALVCKEYLETLGQARAWAWAQIALSLVSVDGDDQFCPPAGPDKRTYARARFQYCITKWFWVPVGERLSKFYADLLGQQTQASEAIEDLSLGNLPTFTPSADSLTNRGDSEEQAEGPTEDIRDYLETQDSTESNSESSPT